MNIATPQTLSVKRGQTAQQKLQISLRSGFHVNSDKPRDEFLIPIKLTWTSGPLQTKQISYPKPEDVKVGDDTLSVFTGKFTIDTEFLAPPQAQAGIATMQGKLRYQACDSRSCKRPATVAVQVPVSIQ
ncbi:MAG TPA: protein-disulfide reductase DsbD domain-containing protein [Bryobacteraceae bacterium]|nr:protein-disulfide reductase DsbD domain-containing protein [Bryobacteraceae bacterium]